MFGKVVGMIGRHPAGAQRIPCGYARVLRPTPTDVIKRPVRATAPNQCGNCVDDQPQLLLALAQSLFGTAAFIAGNAFHGFSWGRHRSSISCGVVARPLRSVSILSRNEPDTPARLQAQRTRRCTPGWICMGSVVRVCANVPAAKRDILPCIA